MSSSKAKGLIALHVSNTLTLLLIATAEAVACWDAKRRTFVVCYQTFRHSFLGPSSGVFFDCLILEGGNDTLCRNAGNQLTARNVPEERRA